VRPMIYTSDWGWGPTGDTEMFARAGHRLWVAHWEVPAPLVPAGYWAGRGWSVWQFSSSGRVRGIRGPVDLNRLSTRLADLRIGQRAPVPRRRLGVRGAS
jgi:GH25 family lysozyme M1 (1,4-beta-N-acetylmuramidase)